MKKIIWAFALCIAFATNAQADLILSGIIDGDLPGGIPKAVIVTANANIADMSIYGVGAANNGGGTDGEEFTFAAGSASAGDVFVIASNSDGADFFNNCFVGVTAFVDGDMGINGDDAIELFQSGSVIDTYGDINVDGTGQSWEYQDGYAIRTGGSAGAFVQGNWDSQNQGLNNLDEAAHKAAIASIFSFEAVPEPTSAVLLGLGGLGLCVVRRRK